MKPQHHKCSPTSDADGMRRLWRDIHLVCFTTACVKYPNVIELWGLSWRIKKNPPTQQKRGAEECFLLKIKGNISEGAKSLLTWGAISSNPVQLLISLIKMAKGRGRNTIIPINNSTHVCHIRKTRIRPEWRWLWPGIDLSRSVRKEGWKDKIDTPRCQTTKTGDKEQTARHTNEKKMSWDVHVAMSTAAPCERS